MNLQQCIDACLACATACERCATACLQEEDVKMMIRCIMLDRECASICYTTASIVAMHGEHLEQVCLTCAIICEACAEECGRHAHLQHCKDCAKACQDCAAACRSKELAA